MKGVCHLLRTGLILLTDKIRKPKKCSLSDKFLFQRQTISCVHWTLFKSSLYLYFQLTFRHVLTMLAIFDCIFITMASATFSLPLISSYWQVVFLLQIVTKLNTNVDILLTIWNNIELYCIQFWGHPYLCILKIPVALVNSVSLLFNLF